MRSATPAHPTGCQACRWATALDSYLNKTCSNTSKFICRRNNLSSGVCGCVRLVLTVFLFIYIIIFSFLLILFIIFIRDFPLFLSVHINFCLISCLTLTSFASQIFWPSILSFYKSDFRFTSATFTFVIYILAMLFSHSLDVNECLGKMECANNSVAAFHRVVLILCLKWIYNNNDD